MERRSRAVEEPPYFVRLATDVSGQSHPGRVSDLVHVIHGNLTQGEVIRLMGAEFRRILQTRSPICKTVADRDTERDPI
jgi:hypothetical protein